MTTLDETRTHSGDTAGPEVAVEQIVGILNDGAICALISIGHELGLFDTMASMPPATSPQVADAAGLDERYVREWLAGLAAAGLVGYEPTAGTYTLSPDHAPFLSGGGPDNLARTMRQVAMMGLVQPKVAEAFRRGGGLSYDDYPGFHTLMAEESAAVLDAALIDAVIPLTGTTEQLRSGIRVVDVGCGAGHAVNLLAREFAASRFLGLDFEAEAVATARSEAAAWGLDNARFEVCDVAKPVTEPGSYDLVTAFDTIHDQARPATVLANIHAALRPGGTFLMVDIKAASTLEDNLALPWGSFVYAISTFHCMSVSLAQGGDGLGTAWGVQTAERMVREAGFSDVVVHELEADPFNVYFVARA